MPGRKRLRAAFAALEGTPGRHREPQPDRPHRARSPCPDAIRAQAARVKVAEKTSLGLAPWGHGVALSLIGEQVHRRGAALPPLAAVGVWAATHSDTYAHSGNGCVTVSLSSSTGGALLHDCGAGARALCRTAFAAHDKTALLTQAQCRIAGLGGLASPAGSPRP